MSRGAQAVEGSRPLLLNQVADVLEERGYLLVPQVRFRAARELGQPIYARQFEAGQDIYGKPRQVDFILYHPDLHSAGLAIQCRWQASSGSVDEKFPFDAFSIRANELDTIIVLDGGGYTDQAKAWLFGQVSETGLIDVLDLAELTDYAHRGKL